MRASVIQFSAKDTPETQLALIKANLTYECACNPASSRPAECPAQQ